MPLVVATLTDQLRSFLDATFEGFVDYPEDEADAAAKWATAIDTYTGTGLLVFPPSVAGLAAKDVLEAGMEGMSVPGAGPVVFDSAFALYCTALAAGMAPAFVATPPPPGTLAPALAAQALLGIVPGGVPAAIQLAAVASIIDAYFHTGTATPASGGPPAPWA